jgi:uncharacterized protein YgiB involved in biofilm formation
VRSLGTCPADLQEVAEAYFMHRLPEDQVDAFEEHYFACPDCAIILQKTGACLEAMRAAARKVRADAPRNAAFGAGHGSN